VDDKNCPAGVSMRYPQWSKSVFSSVGFAQVQGVNGGEVQKELENARRIIPMNGVAMQR
jgi:hypothetical protein